MRFLSPHCLTALLSLCLLTGCGQRLSGVYEGSMVSLAPASDNAKLQQQMESILKKQNETLGMFLKFDGGRVEFGSKAGSKTGRYEIKGDKLELKFDDGKTTVPMTISTNGSITYMTFVFEKK